MGNQHSLLDYNNRADVVIPCHQPDRQRYRQPARQPARGSVRHQPVRQPIAPAPEQSVERDETASDPFSALPLEVVMMVSSYLPITNLFAHRSVSESWREILSSDQPVNNHMKHWGVGNDTETTEGYLEAVTTRAAARERRFKSMYTGQPVAYTHISRYPQSELGLSVGSNYQSAQLQGHYLAYTNEDSSIWLRDLVTGTTVELFVDCEVLVEYRLTNGLIAALQSKATGDGNNTSESIVHVLKLADLTADPKSFTINGIATRFFANKNCVAWTLEHMNEIWIYDAASEKTMLLPVPDPQESLDGYETYLDGIAGVSHIRLDASAKMVAMFRVCVVPAAADGPDLSYEYTQTTIEMARFTFDGVYMGKNHLAVEQAVWDHPLHPWVVYRRQPPVLYRQDANAVVEETGIDNVYSIAVGLSISRFLYMVIDVSDFQRPKLLRQWCGTTWHSRLLFWKNMCFHSEFKVPHHGIVVYSDWNPSDPAREPTPKARINVPTAQGYESAARPSQPVRVVQVNDSFLLARSASAILVYSFEAFGIDHVAKRPAVGNPPRVVRSLTLQETPHTMNLRTRASTRGQEQDDTLMTG